MCQLWTQDKIFGKSHQIHKTRDSLQHQRDGKESRDVTWGAPAAVSQCRQGPSTLGLMWPPVTTPGSPENAVPNPVAFLFLFFS